MRIHDVPLAYKIGGAAVLAFALYVALRGVKGVAADVAGGVVDAGVGVTEGVTLSVGDAIGLPRTSVSACEAAQAAGDTWEASKVCSAGDFISGLFK